MLEVADARKSYGPVEALLGASLRLAPGECTGLLGPNGAGKTTLIRAIGGRVRLDGGDVRLFGRDLAVRGGNGVRRRLGVVPQELALYSTLTARENLDVFGRLLGLRGPTRRDRLQWALDFSGLLDRADDPVRTFSGGMKRRLNIACGVLHHPELVLLDEPTVGVDPQSRERIWEMLGRLQSDGAGLLLTTHQLDEAQQVCERILIIDHGRIIAEGTMRELIARIVGSHHEVTLRLDDPIPADAVPPGLRLHEPDTLRGPVDDVAAELPPLLEQIARTGRHVEDVHLEAPSLHAVFIALTGRELRE